MMSVLMEIVTVSTMRSPISSATGALKAIDSPKSPRRMMLPIHLRYCSCRGRSKANRWYRARIIASSTTSPRRSI